MATPDGSTPYQPQPFKPLPTGPGKRPPPLMAFSQTRNLSDKQFGNIQVPSPERRFTPPAQQFSAWGAQGQ